MGRRIRPNYQRLGLVLSNSHLNRKSQRVPIRLDAGSITQMPRRDLCAILRATDDIIGTGGRNLLTKILRGSASKPVLENGLERSPSYGYFRDLSNDETLAHIDWAILNDFLRIEYRDRLPFLVFTRKGWEIAKDIRANELLDEISMAIRQGPPFEVLLLKDRDREMIFLLINKIEAANDAAFVPMLRAWKKIEYKKVRARIEAAIQHLEGR